MHSDYAITQIAKVCHEANRALQKSNLEDAISPAWEHAPDWQIESAIDGVKKALNGATPEELHQSWFDYKAKEGWAYGPKKDDVAKTHPCMVPYNQLPNSQKLKDAVFHSIVHAMAGIENDL